MGQLSILRNPIQHYAWGTHDTLALMRGVPAPTEQPEAELWVGAHPASPSLVEDAAGGTESLAEIMREDPRRVLPEGLEEFPFLLKILAIASPLSLQVHPTDAQAQAGFEKEEAAGIPVDAPHRNYKDRRSKPETVIAVSPVRILSGIRSDAELTEIAQAFGLAWLGQLAGQDAAQIVTSIFAQSEEAAQTALQATVRAAIDYSLAHPFDEDSPGDPLHRSEDRLAALADLVLLLQDTYPGDRGILVAVAMNQIFLAPGQSAFTPDGQVHAYISGTAVEIMNPSDNVMRAGLTPKHIDVAEMLSVVRPDQPLAPVLEAEPVGPGHGRYRLWDPSLRLDRVESAEGRPVSVEVSGPAAVLCTEGRPVVSHGEQSFPLGGTEALLYTGSTGTLEVSGTGVLYIAGRA